MLFLIMVYILQISYKVAFIFKNLNHELLVSLTFAQKW